MTKVTKDFCLQEWRAGNETPTNEFRWMHPRDQPEGGRNKEVKGKEKIEGREAKEQSQLEGEKEQRESGYIEKQEQQRSMLDTGCETPLASNHTQRNLTEEADWEDADRRQEDEDDEAWTEEWWCPSSPDYVPTPPPPPQLWESCGLAYWEMCSVGSCLHM
ncbi:hypothetical protein NDU88_003637 [Pleurodeles waltl]|uniref:Uncharacterized protein n=1 Tax=Pleurodeles waltl TaxID=8319 RepID=A0AAV7VDZ4_PLEWA|nr:hypothetical protein NDU88_003637 [Pleurodeles waltl]